MSDTTPLDGRARADADIIDALAGIAPGSALARLRDRRPQAREHAQRSFDVLLEPDDPGGFPLTDRYAVATFVAHLHDFGAAAEFYADLLGDEAPDLVAPISAAGAAAADSGPYGRYREPALAAESLPGRVWRPAAETVAVVGDRLAAALAHTHLLVYRPRESEPSELQALLAAGWEADDIVRLSQLVAFLSFQLRTAAGLRALQRSAADRPGADQAEGVSR